MDELHGSNVDPALLELLRAELDTHIPILSDGLLTLEKGRVDDQMVAGMMRAAHSIKGAARIVGIEAAVRVAHAMEDCFTAAKEKRTSLQSAAVDVLLQGVDALQRICSAQSDADRDPVWLDALLDRIGAVRDGQPLTAPVERAAMAPDSVPAPVPSAHSRPDTQQRLTLPTDLDAEAAEQMRAQLCEALGQGVLRICLDFTYVDRISAQGLSVLLSLTREVAGTATTISVDGVAGPLARLMHISGLEHGWSDGG